MLLANIHIILDIKNAPKNEENCILYFLGLELKTITSNRQLI